ncbi:hypothetical protein TNCV_1430441 [Trichonephila clavipes]|nr:hypothetical protein TNCV_1430441 [Trichonephila clavipes]
MEDVTLKFIKRVGIIPEGDIFQISPKEKSGIDKLSECGGLSPFEMTQSSQISVKTSILSRDVLHVAPLAETKISFITVQQEYEFCNYVYVDGWSFHCTSL